MENQGKKSKAMHVALWVAQGLLFITLAMGAVMKFMPIEKIAAMMPWTGELPEITVRLLGVIDLLGVLGVVLPALLRWKPQLTVWAAIGIVLLMISATVFHVSRGEASVIGFNLFTLVMAVFVAWGRFKKAPITAK